MRFVVESVSQSVAIYLVDVLKENKHKLGQHKGQVIKFNIDEKKKNLHQQGDCEEPIKVYKSSSHPGIILQ